MIEFLFCPIHGVLVKLIPFAPLVWIWAGRECSRLVKYLRQRREVVEQCELQDLETRTGG